MEKEENKTLEEEIKGQSFTAKKDLLEDKDDKEDKDEDVKKDDDKESDKLAEYRENLIKQREKIARIEAERDMLLKELESVKSKIEGGESRGKDNERQVFSDIKTSKDLPEDVRAEMTEQELKMFDEIADLKRMVNDLVQSGLGNKADEPKDRSNKDEASSSEQLDETINAVVDIQAIALAEKFGGKISNDDVANIIKDELKYMKIDNIKDAIEKASALAEIKIRESIANDRNINIPPTSTTARTDSKSASDLIDKIVKEDDDFSALEL